MKHNSQGRENYSRGFTFCQRHNRFLGGLPRVNVVGGWPRQVGYARKQRTWLHFCFSSRCRYGMHDRRESCRVDRPLAAPPAEFAKEHVHTSGGILSHHTEQYTRRTLGSLAPTLLPSARVRLSIALFRDRPITGPTACAAVLPRTRAAEASSFFPKRRRCSARRPPEGKGAKTAKNPSCGTTTLRRWPPEKRCLYAAAATVAANGFPPPPPPFGRKRAVSFPLPRALAALPSEVRGAPPKGGPRPLHFWSTMSGRFLLTLPGALLVSARGAN